MAIRQRPLSPHLQVYRWQIQVAASILHRVTGVVLSLGALVIAAGLLMLALGSEHWSMFRRVAGSWPGLCLLFFWSWAFAFHLCNGVRLMIQDMGYGFSLPVLLRSSWLSVIGGLALTVAIWAFVLATEGTS